MVRCGDHYSLQVFVFEQFTEIGIRFCRLAAGGDTLFQTWLIDVAHRGKIDVLLIAEIVNMLTSDETESDTPKYQRHRPMHNQRQDFGTLSA